MSKSKAEYEMELLINAREECDKSNTIVLFFSTFIKGFIFEIVPDDALEISTTIGFNLVEFN